MHQWDASEILVLQNAIERANTQSEVTLRLAKIKVERAAQEAEQANQELEKSYAQNITTVNAYFDRLRDHRATGRTNPVPSCESAGTPETTSAEFAQTAYQIEAYANSCWRFVENECGIRTKE
jgi:hypothetical protein